MMKFVIHFVRLHWVRAAWLCVVAIAPSHGEVANDCLLPVPVSVELLADAFPLHDAMDLVAPAAWKDEAARFAEDFQKVSGLKLMVRDRGGDHGIRFVVDPTSQAEDGYQLRVDASGVMISASSATGVFYGGRTLLQWVAAQANHGFASIPGIVVDDHPRFGWRGLMLDCSRTFQSIDYLKSTIDRMAAIKMNVLHLHLTDDQGWRIEIKSHPELTQAGAYFSKKFNEPARHEGYYTSKQMKDLVAYAAARHVMIVPEIEMPGHSHEVFVSRPDLCCAGQTTAEIFPFFHGPTTTSDVFCAGNEQSFRYLQDILDEVIAIFPCKWVHIGGDEVPKSAWKACKKCQARMKAEGVANEHELQSYFIRRMEKYLTSKGRRLVGWDEILEGGLAANATVMSWRGVNGGVAAALAGHDVVMSPTSHCYFDYTYQAINSQRVFSFDPLAGINPQAAHHVLGVQANFWSHIDREPELVDRQLFPRLMALAERGWSPDNRGDWDGYVRRANAQIPWLKKSGIHYQPSDLPAPIASNPP